MADTSRRHFIKTMGTVGAGALAGVGAAGLWVGSGAVWANGRPTAGNIALPAGATMPERVLGRTGQRVSLLGLGGAHLGSQRDEQLSIRIIRQAIDHGVTFLDNCWSYHGGQSEIRMGKALRDGYRKKVFLMTKVDGRNERAAAKQLEQCLRRLQTDVIDLVQVHEVIRTSDVERVFAPGGAMEALVAAKQAGKLRYIGFTGHKDPALHLRMLEQAFARDFTFDTVQMPLNVMDPHYRSFEKRVLPLLRKHDIGVLGMKPLGGGYILQSDTVGPEQCLHYAMNLPLSVVITGCETVGVLQQALRAAYTFAPLSEHEVEQLRDRTAKAGARGRYEKFKTSRRFDSTARNPHWLRSAEL